MTPPKPRTHFGALLEIRVLRDEIQTLRDQARKDRMARDRWREKALVRRQSKQAVLRQLKSQAEEEWKSRETQLRGEIRTLRRQNVAAREQRDRWRLEASSAHEMLHRRKRP